jgi:hypothetical protein
MVLFQNLSYELIGSAISALACCMVVASKV